MLLVRGTKKLRDRVKGLSASDSDASSTLLGDWFATALFWRPQVALLVNARTFVPVFMELAPAATLLERVPVAIEEVLRAHGVKESFLATEREAMAAVRIAPTNDRSVLGVMNEFAFLGEHHQSSGHADLVALSLRIAHTPVSPLHKRSGYPDLELAEVVGGTEGLAEVIPIRPGVTPDGETARTGSKPARRAFSSGGSKTPGRGTIYQLQITLLDTKPRIWRRVVVDGAATLGQLHEVIQAAFGWWNYHLHEFEIDGKRYGMPDPDADWGEPARDESEVRLDRVAENGTTFDYVYDFGDNWHHRIVVEKVLPADSATTVPACTGGRRAGPPEDCGGTWGYRELLEILVDPTHPEHEERLTWLGGSFDPDAFDPAEFPENLEALETARIEDPW